MVIAVSEILHFKVKPQERQEWLNKDAEVWTHFLAQQPGFIKKEVWLTDETSDDLTIAVWWQSNESFQAVTPEHQAEIDKRMGIFSRPSIRMELKQVSLAVENTR